MQMVDRPSLCIRQHCLDRTRVYTYARVHARLVAAPCRHTFLPEGRSRPRSAASCSSTATSSADPRVMHQVHGITEALRLVQNLAEDLDCLKQRPLSPACSLSMYRLTKLCTNHQQQEVALALAQDSSKNDGRGVFLDMVQLLQQDGDASRQGQSVAADLIQAMLSSYCDILALEKAPANAIGLPHLHQAFDCNGLLDVLVSSKNPKVKTSALLVLLLISATDPDGQRKVSEAGTAVVTLLEMLSVSGSWPAFSLPAQPSGAAGVLAASQAELPQAVPSEVTASLPFMAACTALLHCLYFPKTADGDTTADLLGFCAKLVDTNLRAGAAMLAFAAGTCNWQLAQQPTPLASHPLARGRQWWWRLAPSFALAAWPFYWSCAAVFNMFRQPRVSASRMLWLADRIRKHRQAALHMIEVSEAVGLEAAIKDVARSVLRNQDDQCVALGHQRERDALVRPNRSLLRGGPHSAVCNIPLKLPICLPRCLTTRLRLHCSLTYNLRVITPSLLALLQHPVEDRRAFAAEYACVLGIHASGVIFSALLSSSNGLSTLLTRLSGDDTPKSRCFYAGLIACCAGHHACGVAALKKISDSGAVPYLLKLLREADGQCEQYHAVLCLERLALASKDIRTSIVVHGGTQQLLDLVQAGFQKGRDTKLQPEQEMRICGSINILCHMLHVPGAEAEIIKADLASVVVQFMQGPSLGSESTHVTVLNALYLFSGRPVGRQQLLEKLTPDSLRIMIDLSLNCLEAPDPNHSGLSIAADLLRLAGELTAGRQQLALPAVGARLTAVLTGRPYSTQAQGYVLPSLASLSYLKPDGSYYPNPWLIQPTPASDGSPSQTSEQAQQLSREDSQPSSEPVPQQLLAAASARMSQRSSAELAHAAPSHDATSATLQAQQSSAASVEGEPEPHRGQDFQEGLVRAAALLVSKSPLPRSRFQSMAWLRSLVPELSDQGCRAVGNSEAVLASVRVLQQESEAPETRAQAIVFCLCLHDRGTLPLAVLLDAGVHQHLTKLVVQSDDTAEILVPAGTLLWVLWQAQPPLVSKFVSQRNLPALLKRLAQASGAPLCLVLLRLVQQVWSFTASLVSEPLLLQAIPGIVRCCGELAADQGAQSSLVLHLQADLQEESASLLCSMAEFPFYRPAIRKADPAGALSSMLEAGCSPDDGQQHRTIAQLALHLVYKLLKGQMDESDGPDAPYNHTFLQAITLHGHAASSIMRMCKQGSLESRHAALAVLWLCLVHRQRPLYLYHMQEVFISLGLMPLLFGIAQAPDSTAEMRSMADECLAGVHSDLNSYMASFGTHCLIARLIALTFAERRAAANADRHGR